jgi:hypothetical protein
MVLAAFVQLAFSSIDREASDSDSLASRMVKNPSRAASLPPNGFRPSIAGSGSGMPFAP